MEPPDKIPVFHRFLLLPLEIRTKIWIFALRVPRHVTILAKFVHSSPPPEPEYRHEAYYYVEQGPPPALTHVSSESRFLSQKHYSQAFQIGLRPRYIYINFSFDTIIMPDYDFKNLYHGQDRSAIQRLLLLVEYTNVFNGWYGGFRPLLFDMPRLEEVTAIYREGQHPQERPVRFYEDKLRAAFVWEHSKCRRRAGWVCPDIRIVVEGDVDEFALRDVKVMTRECGYDRETCERTSWRY